MEFANLPALLLLRLEKSLGERRDQLGREEARTLPGRFYTFGAPEDRGERGLQACEGVLQPWERGENIRDYVVLMLRVFFLKKQLSLPGHHMAGGVIQVS